MEKFKMVLTKVVTDDETKAVVSEEVVAEEEYKGVAVLGECFDDGRMNEVVMHLSLSNIAAMLASGEHTSVACKLANLMMDMEKQVQSKKEDLLAALLMHGAKGATEKGE